MVLLSRQFKSIEKVTDILFAKDIGHFYKRSYATHAHSWLLIADLLYFFSVKKVSIILCGVLLGCSALLLAQNKPSGYWQQQADYRINVQLNDTANTLDGNVQIHYINNSPDTLHFLWMHLWPNAYKNDQTAYAEQSLLEGSTDFYFSKARQKGYINQLQFTANGMHAMLEDHPKYIDVAKLVLQRPLLPGMELNISTPFHVQLPALFSRSGHMGQFYAIAQWFPKVAMYDEAGWHPMPYLSAGEYYSNFGNYDVSITLPDNYVVAATGTLHNDEEISWMKKRKSPVAENTPTKKTAPLNKKATPKFPTPASSRKMKTLHYTAENVVDFVWSADKRFIVKYDTSLIGSNAIHVWNFILPEDEKRWSKSMLFSKRALKFYSNQLGNYPYPQVTVVASPGSEADGMEYPMLTMLNEQTGDEKLLDIIITHEIGHNWLQAVLATNERDNGWMDEGMNTYFEDKYTVANYPAPKPNSKFPEDLTFTLLDFLYESKQDAPMQVSADAVLPTVLYPAIYQKTGKWMELLEQQIGKEKMDALMKQYFQQWKFKHPQPADFQALASTVSGKSLQPTFDLLHQQGALEKPGKKQTTFTALFNLNGTEKRKYIGIAPAIGYNKYDKFEIGLLLHNYNVPANKFQFVVAPMYGTGSKKAIGYGRFSYHWYPKGKIYKAELYAGLARFNTNYGYDEAHNTLPVSFTKLTPGITLELRKRNALSTLHRRIDFRTFIISEQQLKFESPAPPGDTVFYSVRNGSVTTVIPQLSMTWSNDRKLYPWSVQASIQQVKQIVRSTATANYFLNYDKTEKGLSVRLFAGKIFYTTEKTTTVRNENSRYHFTMYAPNGTQDYTYSNPFVERNQSTELAGRQIAMRDGGFKYRSDYSAVVPGLKPTGVDYFDNWMVTLNTDFDIPDKINPLSLLPFENSLKIFADVGTSASPWQTGSDQAKFLYSIGIHLPIMKVVHLYYPIFQSKAFKEPNSVNDPFREGGPTWWQQRLTFSLSLDQLKPKSGGLSIL